MKLWLKLLVTTIILIVLLVSFGVAFLLAPSLSPAVIVLNSPFSQAKINLDRGAMNQIYAFDKVGTFPVAGDVRKIIFIPTDKFVESSYETGVGESDTLYSITSQSLKYVLVVNVHINLAAAKNVQAEQRNSILSKFLIQYLSWQDNLNTAQVSKNLGLILTHKLYPFKLGI